MRAYVHDQELGMMPVAPCPFYLWQFWKWQKVRCECGQTFISRDLGLMPREYEHHWILEHGSDVEATEEDQ